MERYGNDNIERTRDLFEQVLEHAPSDACHVFYLMYADFEEQYGFFFLSFFLFLYPPLFLLSPPSHPPFHHFLLLLSLGLARRAMYVYDRATRAVDEASRATIFTIYIARAREVFYI